MLETLYTFRGRPMRVECRRIDGVGETLPPYLDGLQGLLDDAFWAGRGDIGYMPWTLPRRTGRLD